MYFYYILILSYGGLSMTTERAIIHWKEIEKMNADESILIDVRTKEEFVLGAISGAVNIPLEQLPARISEIPRHKAIIVYCRVGSRSNQAYKILMENGFRKVKYLSGGYNSYYSEVYSNKKILNFCKNTNKNLIPAPEEEYTADVVINACGKQCPGPIMQLYKKISMMKPGEILEISATDPGFDRDLAAWCDRTGNQLLNIEKNQKIITALIRKNDDDNRKQLINKIGGNDKTMVVFSGDFDKAVASFIIANGAAAMGRKVTMFFTFWGLNILRKNEKVNAKKSLLESIFGWMMPRGSQKLGLSKMNMGGFGGKMIRYIMNKKNVSTLEDLIQQAKVHGVNIVACSMSMDIMGIKDEELIDGVEIGGVASYLGAAEQADTNLFI